MDAIQIQDYWNTRAKEKSAHATTDDVYLREIEFRVVKNVLDGMGLDRILDIGCGDALTTSRLAREFPRFQFEGIDFSPAMIERAAVNVGDLPNIAVRVGDISSPLDVQDMGIIYTNRCLINLSSWSAQKQALSHIGDAIRAGGYFLMIENFIEGHQAFNTVRKSFGLPEIPVRSHNLFFCQNELIEFMRRQFLLRQEENISSSYYLATRVLYSRLCADAGTPPDYFDPHHKYAAQLPFAGEFGPVRALLFQKRHAPVD